MPEWGSFLLVVAICLYAHYSSEVCDKNPDVTKDINKMTENIIKYTFLAIFLAMIIKSVFKF